VIANGGVKVCVSSAGGKEAYPGDAGPRAVLRGDGSARRMPPAPRAWWHSCRPSPTGSSATTFERLLEQHPTIARKLLRELSLRLRRANAQNGVTGHARRGREAGATISSAWRGQHGQILATAGLRSGGSDAPIIANSTMGLAETVTRLDQRPRSSEASSSTKEDELLEGIRAVLRARE